MGATVVSGARVPTGRMAFLLVVTVVMLVMAVMGPQAAMAGSVGRGALHLRGGLPGLLALTVMVEMGVSVESEVPGAMVLPERTEPLLVRAEAMLVMAVMAPLGGVVAWAD